MAEKDHTVTFELHGDVGELTENAVWETLARGGFGRTDAVRKRFEVLYPLGRTLLEPRALGRIVRASSLSDTERSDLPEPIQGAEFLCFCVSTAGRAIDDRARALCDEGELIDSMIMDAIAMAGLSTIGSRLGQEVFQWAAQQGLPASRSFSPGAGASHWGLEHQQFLFRHLPERPLGVELTASFLMKPSKSVSFVIGIGSEVNPAMHPFSCEGCDRFDCAYRHIPEGEMLRSETGRTNSSQEEAT